MTSPYYNGFVALQNNLQSNLQYDAPTSYDACDECGTDGRGNNPVTGAKFGTEVIFQCQDCSLKEIYTELEKENQIV